MSDLSSELRFLRRGRGVMVSDLQQRIGPALRTRAGVSKSDGLPEARDRLIAYLNGLAATLPEDLGLIFSVTLALRQGTQFRFLENRMQWLSTELDRDVRTISRRFDEALNLLNYADRDYTDEEFQVGEHPDQSVDSGPVNYQIIFTYGLTAPHPGTAIKIGFITGDIRRVKCADVWVNPENTSMIMARFEEHSVSAVVRYEGAVRDELGHVTDDRVADELREKVAPRGQVAPGTVIVTGAGELLRSNNVRNVVHVASVYGEPGRGYRQVRDIGRCVTGALAEMDRLNDADPSLHTVLIPILGTGVGGGDPETTIPAMLDAAIDHLAASEPRVRTVLFLAYTAAELALCRAAFAGCPRLTPTEGSAAGDGDR